MSRPWWRDAVVYQIYPRSFADANGDGIGDLAGVRSRLDHLEWLGVDAVWLCPIQPSPQADFGYDVADHIAVHDEYGTMDDLDGLLADLHARGMRLILDWVPNHTSDHHPWFVEARSDRSSRHRSWYVWRDPSPDGGRPNNWESAFSEPPEWIRDPATGQLSLKGYASGSASRAGSAWTFDELTQQWYLHLFLPQQPDLDWTNPEVESAMHDVLRFWLDRGVDGFRADVIQAIGKDVPEGSDQRDETQIHSERTHHLLRRIRTLLDAYDGDRMIVGEVFLFDTPTVARFHGTSDQPELHLALHFPPLFTPWDAAGWRGRIEEVEEHFAAPPAWPTWALSNHDIVRHRSRYGTEARARAAAVMLLTLRGTPFVYAGEELGLEDAVIAPEARLDPGGRDGCRAPIPWDATHGHGWGAPTWRPFPPDAAARSVAAQTGDRSSMLHLYRDLIALRRRSPALKAGSLRLLDSPRGVVAWERRGEDDRRVAAVNFTDRDQELELDEGPWLQDIASDRAGEGLAYEGRLAPDQAVVLRRQRR